MKVTNYLLFCIFCLDSVSGFSLKPRANKALSYSLKSTFNPVLAAHHLMDFLIFSYLMWFMAST